MPKLPNVTPKQLGALLEKLGFQLDHTTGSHFVFYHPKTKRRAVVPYHTKELPKGTVMNILREAGITKDDLVKGLSRKR